MSILKDLLNVTDADIAEARKRYNKSEWDIQQDVAILKEWLRQQPHLPDNEDEGRLERMLLKNKFRLEQTKNKLDQCYSFRTSYPEMLDMYEVNAVTIQNARKSMILVPLPKLTDKQERVFIFKHMNTETYRVSDGVLYTLMIIELCITYDYSLADILIIDWDSVSLNIIKTIDPSMMKKFVAITMGCLSGRISSIQYINTPTFVDISLQMCKLLLKPKLFQKINCNSSVDDLHSLFPKNILPIEYGGEEKSIYELHEQWGKELPNQSDMLTKLSKMTTKERLRIAKLDDSDLFGIDGSFKKINLD